MNIYIETERLMLREILPTDVDGMFELDSDPEVHRYLGNNPVKDKRQTMDVIEFIRQQYVEFGIGRWAVIEKQTNNFMGWSGLKYVTEEMNGRKNFHDLGYRLIKRYWGNGFATEAAVASVNYGFETLGLSEIYAIADVENRGSNSILRKIGMSLKETFYLDGTKHHWYEIVCMICAHRLNL